MHLNQRQYKLDGTQNLCTTFESFHRTQANACRNNNISSRGTQFVSFNAIWFMISLKSFENFPFTLIDVYVFLFFTQPRRLALFLYYYSRLTRVFEQNKQTNSNQVQRNLCVNDIFDLKQLLFFNAVQPSW